MRAPALWVSSSGYTYAGIVYANPDAPTQIANGVSTTTFAYDNNGNVVQKTVDGTTTTYVYLDYYPYGATRISDGTGANEKRTFIGQFGDDSGLQ
jgi:hypothetical protein